MSANYQMEGGGIRMCSSSISSSVRASIQTAQMLQLAKLHSKHIDKDLDQKALYNFPS
ncbi:MAG: hypothetical protein PQJ46_14645 [Spirochaetales bacterium]|nr:hypothetical protein [Spirochaetales bacterium]